ncbi:MAG: DUF333 domain-containing protein [Neisseria sp.]|nr:DUF333 domain-containing protein [Neisseria sp.]
MKSALPLLILALTAACSSASAPQTGTANPASVYCVEQGGESLTQKADTGDEYGICKLPDGTVVEEWEYFRKNNPAQKPAQ